MKRIIPHNYGHEIKQGKRLSKQQKIANGLFWREYHYQKDNPPVVLPKGDANDLAPVLFLIEQRNKSFIGALQRWETNPYKRKGVK